MSEFNVEEDVVSYYVFVKNGYRHFGPQYLSAGMTTDQYIFPIPEPNAVGTIDKYNNAITFIKFGGYGAEPECYIVSQNFSKNVYDIDFIYRFSQNFSDDMIVYSETWDVVIANIKTGEAFYARCALSMDDFIHGIRFLNPQENLFAIVKSIDEGNDSWKDYLHVAKLEGRQLVDSGWSVHIGETHEMTSDFPLYHTWFVHDRKLFVYDNGKILCTDGSQPVPHPFAEVFNANNERIGNIRDIAIHPTLPFGVMIEDSVSLDISHKLTVVCWKAKKPKNQIVVFSDIFRPLASLFGLKRMAFAYQSFSPDGNWYVVGCISPEAAAVTHKPQAPFFIAIPIVNKRPSFFVVEDIIILGQIKNMTSLAWTTAHVSFV